MTVDDAAVDDGAPANDAGACLGKKVASTVPTGADAASGGAEGCRGGVATLKAGPPTPGRRFPMGAPMGSAAAAPFGFALGMAFTGSGFEEAGLEDAGGGGFEGAGLEDAGFEGGGPEGALAVAGASGSAFAGADAQFADAALDCATLIRARQRLAISETDLEAASGEEVEPRRRA